MSSETKIAAISFFFPSLYSSAGSGFTNISNFSPSKENLATVTSAISIVCMIIWYLSLHTKLCKNCYNHITTSIQKKIFLITDQFKCFFIILV
ncbi:MAG: DUF443 family protein [Nitrosopumilus sp.]|nr:MAG: DUF443 family protein [Nitrosopumilus sp.]